MKRDSERVRELFSTHARDWTPSGWRGSANVLFAPVLDDPETSRRCASVLSDAELPQAERFLSDAHKAHFKQRRAFRRYCGALALRRARSLSDINFKTTEKGRPYLPELPEVWFSFSSCRLGYLGAWSSTHSIGVDFEDTSRSLEALELARRYFSKNEATAVEGLGDCARLPTFYQLWTLKEAALKSIGEGLPFGLDAFQFELSPDLQILQAPPDYGGAAQFKANMMQKAGGCAAVVLRSRAQEMSL